MMAEYFSYRLCGVAANEYTNASTTSLLNAEERTWDNGLLDRLGYPGEIFSQPVMPPYPLGSFTDEVKKEVGYTAEVVLCPTHDTAAAVAACPLDEGTMYISSGTWSLAGIETDKPTINEQSAKHNWTNEGGIDGKYRFLKNIMGLWLMQNVRIEDGNRHNHTELAKLAAKSTFDGTFDVNDPVFTAPENMTAEIKKKLGEDDLSIGDLARSVYRSLALSYAKTAGSVQELTGKKIERILIVGGGSANEFLNEQTALACSVPVITGLTEGTAVGNIISQYMQDSGSTLAQAREIIKNSFDFKEIEL